MNITPNNLLLLSQYLQWQQIVFCDSEASALRYEFRVKCYVYKTAYTTSCNLDCVDLVSSIILDNV